MSGAIVGFLVGIYAGWMICGVVTLCLADYIYGGNDKQPLDEKGEK